MLPGSVICGDRDSYGECGARPCNNCVVNCVLASSPGCGYTSPYDNPELLYIRAMGASL